MIGGARTWLMARAICVVCFVSVIAYLSAEATESNSYNEMLTINVDDQSVFLRSMGMAMRGGDFSHLTQEGGADLFKSDDHKKAMDACGGYVRLSDFASLGE